jgi:hypothetical protein
MGQQLIISNFYKPNNVTLSDVMEYVAKPEPFEVIPPSNKEIRLAIDLAKQLNPLFEFHVQEHTDLIRRLCQYDVSDEKILNVKPFKQILYKEIIVGVKHIGDGKYKVKLKRVLRTHT